MFYLATKYRIIEIDPKKLIKWVGTHVSIVLLCSIPSQKHETYFQYIVVLTGSNRRIRLKIMNYGWNENASQSNPTHPIRFVWHILGFGESSEYFIDPISYHLHYFILINIGIVLLAAATRRIWQSPFGFLPHLDHSIHMGNSNMFAFSGWLHEPS